MNLLSRKTSAVCHIVVHLDIDPSFPARCEEKLFKVVHILKLCSRACDTAKVRRMHRVSGHPIMISRISDKIFGNRFPAAT